VVDLVVCSNRRLVCGHGAEGDRQVNITRGLLLFPRAIGFGRVDGTICTAYDMIGVYSIVNA
jgi:hypothetical protein